MQPTASRPHAETHPQISWLFSFPLRRLDDSRIPNRRLLDRKSLRQLVACRTKKKKKKTGNSPRKIGPSRHTLRLPIVAPHGRRCRWPLGRCHNMHVRHTSIPTHAEAGKGKNISMTNSPPIMSAFSRPNLPLEAMPKPFGRVPVGNNPI